MYKCTECGHVFENASHWHESHGFRDGSYERFSGCPRCLSPYEEAVYCANCEGLFLESELYHGYCANCLRATIDFDSFFDYLQDTGLFGHFMFEHILESTQPKTSEKLNTAMVVFYRLLSQRDEKRKTPVFAGACASYIMDADGESGRDDYAEWLKEREGKHVKVNMRNG